MINRATIEHDFPTVAAATMRPPWLDDILARRVASEGQHFASQHDRAKYENSAAICGLSPGLGNLRCTIDRVRERLAHIYPVGTEDLFRDLGQARDIGRALARHLGNNQVIEEGLDLGQDALDVLVPHRRIHTHDARKPKGGFHGLAQGPHPRGYARRPR